MEFTGFKDILVPVDFSKYANKAYFQALHLAGCSDAEITVLYVMDTDIIKGVAHIESQKDMVARWRKRARPIWPCRSVRESRVRWCCSPGRLWCGV